MNGYTNPVESQSSTSANPDALSTTGFEANHKKLPKHQETKRHNQLSNFDDVKNHLPDALNGGLFRYKNYKIQVFDVSND